MFCVSGLKMPLGIRWSACLPILVDHGVAGVVAALKADDHIGILGQIVDDAAFAFIAPLGADDCGNGHDFIPVPLADPE